MSGARPGFIPQNYLIVGLTLAVTLFTAWHEGYFAFISVSFWIFLALGFGLAFWVAAQISSRRLLSLAVSIFIMEYIKETIGIRAGLWVYHGVNGFYNFGVWAWVLGGISAYTLGTRIIRPLIRRLQPGVSHRRQVAIIGILFLLIPLGLGGYWGGTGAWFWGFYILTLAADLWVASRVDFPLLAGMVAAAWLVGNTGEYLGGPVSGVWTFPRDPRYPPLFLLFGCWPLEILAQYALSAVLANEALDQPS